MDPELKPPPLTLQKGKRPAQETAPSRPQAQTDSAVPRKPIQNLTVNVPQPRGDSSGLPPRPLSKVPVSPLSTSKQVSHQEQQSTLASSGPFMPGSLPPHQQAAPKQLPLDTMKDRAESPSVRRKPIKPLSEGQSSLDSKQPQLPQVGKRVAKRGQRQREEQPDHEIQPKQTHQPPNKLAPSTKPDANRRRPRGSVKRDTKVEVAEQIPGNSRLKVPQSSRKPEPRTTLPSEAGNGPDLTQVPMPNPQRREDPTPKNMLSNETRSAQDPRPQATQPKKETNNVQSDDPKKSESSRSRRPPRAVTVEDEAAERVHAASLDRTDYNHADRKAYPGRSQVDVLLRDVKPAKSQAHLDVGSRTDQPKQQLEVSRADEPGRPEARPAPPRVPAVKIKDETGYQATSMGSAERNRSNRRLPSGSSRVNFIAGDMKTEESQAITNTRPSTSQMKHQADNIHPKEPRSEEPRRHNPRVQSLDEEKPDKSRTATENREDHSHFNQMAQPGNLQPNASIEDSIPMKSPAHRYQQPSVSRQRRVEPGPSHLQVPQQKDLSDETGSQVGEEVPFSLRIDEPIPQLHNRAQPETRRQEPDTMSPRETMAYEAQKSGPPPSRNQPQRSNTSRPFPQQPPSGPSPNSQQQLQDQDLPHRPPPFPTHPQNGPPLHQIPRKPLGSPPRPPPPSAGIGLMPLSSNPPIPRQQSPPSRSNTTSPPISILSRPSPPRSSKFTASPPRPPPSRSNTVSPTSPPRPPPPAVSPFVGTGISTFTLPTRFEREEFQPQPPSHSNTGSSVTSESSTKPLNTKRRGMGTERGYASDSSDPEQGRGNFGHGSGNGTQTPYLNMIMSLDRIPRLHNILAVVFVWLLLLGFVLFPGSFTRTERQPSVSSEQPPNNNNEGTTIRVGQITVNVPLSLAQRVALVLASVFILTGVFGTAWLALRWRRNYIWLLNKLYLPLILNGLTGLGATLIAVYAQHNGEWCPQAIAVASVEGVVVVVSGGLFGGYNWCLMDRVRGFEEVKEEKREKRRKERGGRRRRVGLWGRLRGVRRKRSVAPGSVV